jgi:SAM-dependent methyltransferase
LIEVSRRFWSGGAKSVGVDLGDYSHWEGAGPWLDQERWLALGAPHFRLSERLCEYSGVRRPLRRIVEWGCGGGANAVHFLNEAELYCGVDITQASIDECRRALQARGYQGFEGAVVAPQDPEAFLERSREPFDFFLCTYVFELLPSRAYGERILRVASALLRPGGAGLIQIRYNDGSEGGAQLATRYFQDCARFNSYPIDQFWQHLEQAGLRPEFVHLVPTQLPGYSGSRYAYFAFVKPEDGSAPVRPTSAQPSLT